MEMEADCYGNKFYIIIGSFRGQTWIVDDEDNGHQCQFFTRDRADSYIRRRLDVWDKEAKYTVHGIK
jgi:hypothetical protein